jgi:hypothetical protein
MESKTVQSVIRGNLTMIFGITKSRPAPAKTMSIIGFARSALTLKPSGSTKKSCFTVAWTINGQVSGGLDSVADNGVPLHTHVRQSATPVRQDTAVHGSETHGT